MSTVAEQFAEMLAAAKRVARHWRAVADEIHAEVCERG